MQLRPGQLLSSKYRLIRELGKGGMGSVWHAQHLVLNAPVALKFIESRKLAGAAQQRFLAEARVAAALRSPHVVQILDYGVEEGTPHIAMELLEGESLASRLERVRALGPRETGRVIQHVVRALGRAHDAGIVHRDLKPENVFISVNDDDELIKVLDFGIAKADKNVLGDSAAADTCTGDLLGTPYYMSPEQLEDSLQVDHRTDIWALGVLAFRCLTGHLPFGGDSVGRLVLAICSRPLPVPSEVAQVPAGFDVWFARACAREPDQRFATIREAWTAFAPMCGEHAHGSSDAPAPAADPTSPASRAAGDPLGETTGHATNSEIGSRAVSRRRRRWALPALLAGLGLAALTGRTWLMPEPSPREAADAIAPDGPPSPSPLASRRESPSEPAHTPAPPNAAPIPQKVAQGLSGPAPGAAESSRVAAAPELPRAKVKAERADPAAKERAPQPKPAPAKPPTPTRVPWVPPEDLDLGI